MMQDHKLDRDPDDVVTLMAPARLKRVGREMKLLVENSGDQTAADPSLLRIMRALTTSRRASFTIPS